jgi:hypothetical protein
MKASKGQDKHATGQRINLSSAHLTQPLPRIPPPRNAFPTLILRFNSSFMNISIDDLVSSFSASHVSQEAMDIATLQVILSPFSPLERHSFVTSVPTRKSDLLSLSRTTRRTLCHPPQQLRTAMYHTHPLLSNCIFSLGMGGV